MASGFAGLGSSIRSIRFLKADRSNIVYVRPKEDVTVDLDPYVYVYDENSHYPGPSERSVLSTKMGRSPRYKGCPDLHHL